jgi:hypothetical protein
MAGHEWVLYSVGAFLQIDLPQAVWLVDTLVPGDGFVLLCAPPKVGKTTLAAQVGGAIRHGAPFLGHATTLPRRVLVMQADNPAGDWHTHMKDVVHAPGVVDLDFVLCAPHYVGDPTKTQLAKQRIQDAKPHFVIFDALETTVRPEWNLNDREGMQRALAALRTLWPGPSMLVHHLRKPPVGGQDVGWAAPAGHHSLTGSASVLWSLIGTDKKATLHVRGRGVKGSTFPLIRNAQGLWVLNKGPTPPGTAAGDDLYTMPLA